MHSSLLAYSAIFAALATAPAAAADRVTDFSYASEGHVSSGYVGATISLLRLGEGKGRPSLRLGAGIRHQPLRTTSVSIALPSTVEFRLNGGKNQGMYFGGKRLALSEGEGGLGTGEIILIAVGIAATALLITQVAGSDDDDDSDDECLIEPWMCPQ